MSFHGNNLMRLRELHGFSRKNLASRLNVSEQSIWKYENENIIPRIDVINNILNLFNVTSQFFFSKEYIERDIINKEHVAYRSADRKSTKRSKYELQYLNFANFFIDYFEQSLNAPKNRIYDLQKTALRITKNGNSDQNIKKLAEYARNFLSLNDNKHLMHVLENNGVYVLERKNLGSQIDAYSSITKDHKSFIVLGTARKTAVRINFGLAHELGHLLMHQEIDMEILSDQEYEVIERQAHCFAAYFLLPEDDFKHDFKHVKDVSNPLAYLDLKQKYRVSISAMEYYAYRLKLIDYQQNRFFWGKLTQKGYRYFEPLDDKIIPMLPGRMHSMFKAVFENHIFNVENIRNELYLKPQFLIELFNLDDDFFKPFDQEAPKYYSHHKAPSVKNCSN